MNCIKCGMELMAADVYCRNCGMKLSVIESGKSNNDVGPHDNNIRTDTVTESVAPEASKNKLKTKANKGGLFESYAWAFHWKMFPEEINEELKCKRSTPRGCLSAWLLFSAIFLAVLPQLNQDLVFNGVQFVIILCVAAAIFFTSSRVAIVFAGILAVGGFISKVLYTFNNPGEAYQFWGALFFWGVQMKIVIAAYQVESARKNGRKEWGNKSPASIDAAKESIHTHNRAMTQQEEKGAQWGLFISEPAGKVAVPIVGDIVWGLHEILDFLPDRHWVAVLTESDVIFLPINHNKFPELADMRWIDMGQPLVSSGRRIIVSRGEKNRLIFRRSLTSWWPSKLIIEDANGSILTVELTLSTLEKIAEWVGAANALS